MQSIEKQIRLTVPRKVVFDTGDARRENQAFRRDATVFGFVTKITRGGRIIVLQPQHAAVDGAEKPHPDIENAGSILYDWLKQQKTNPFPAGPNSPGTASVARCARGIVRHEASRQPHYLFAVAAKMFSRNHRRIGKDIVVMRSAHGAWIA